MIQTKTELGTLPTYRGTYASETTYYRDNIVRYGEHVYICKSASTTSLPTTAANWDLLVTGTSIEQSEGTLTTSVMSQKAVTDALSERDAAIDVNSHDIDTLLEPRYDGALPTLCGQPPILYGNGTPQEAVVPYNWRQFDPEGNPNGSLEDGTAATGYNWNGSPSAEGQQYINVAVTPAGRYIAVRQSYDKSSSNYYTLIWKQC